MTRKRFQKLMLAVGTRLNKTTGKGYASGQQLRFYSTRNINNIEPTSYAEAWEMMKPLADAVGIKTR